MEDMMKRGPKDDSKKSMIAGILMIIAFLLAAYNAASFFFLDVDVGNIEEQVGEQISQDLVNTVINVCGAVTLVFGFFLLLGGYFAIKREHRIIAIIGSILGILSIGPLFLGSIFSVAALVLLLMAKDEFESKKSKPQYEQEMTL